jgi:phosphate transport system substrate-binding protein
VAVVAVALMSGAAFIVTGLDDSPVPPFLEPGFAPKPEPAAFDDKALHVAGSGSNLPLTRALARAYGRVRPVVHPSIGSGGGVRAVLDGAIGIGLFSGPLQPYVRERGLVATPYARIPIVVAAHADVPDTSITTRRLVDIYAGRETRWSDGRRIFVLQREPGDSSHTAFNSVVPGFAEANEEAYRANRWRVLYHDDAMQEALGNTLGSVGLHAGVVDHRREVKTLAVDDVEPRPQTVADGSYPYMKDLAFITVGPPQGAAKAFIDFVRSDAGAATIRTGGAVPVGGGS